MRTEMKWLWAPRDAPLPSSVSMIGLLALTCLQTAPSWRDDVRPLLAEHCFACHGPDEATRAAGLRLDVSQGLAKVIVAGDPDASELHYRVTSEDDFDRMPPPAHGEPLAAAEQETLRRWIEAGASWAPHWAYAPFGAVRVPEVQPVQHAENGAWPRNPIDHFVLARLELEGLAPAPEADPRALLRRVHLDLTGLPPTEQELASYLADDQPDAYERRVDTLLASVHFAERFARHWLDLARYADSNGFTIDSARSIWPWRDWVVRSLDRDQPFDEFTLEQLAGDLLPDATREQRLATGFHRNTQTNEEGGADDEENRVQALFDRVHTTGAVWLGTTIGCAQCHTHKFDPITARDYYRFYAFFDQTRDGGVSLAPTMLVARDDDEDQRASRWEDRLAELQREHDLAHTASTAGYSTWRPLRAWASNGTKLRAEEDGSFTAVGQNAVYSTYVLEGDAPDGPGATRRLRLEALPNADLPSGGPGRGGNGNFVLQAVRLFERENGETTWTPVALRGARADFEQDTRAGGGGHFPAASVLGAGPGWAILPRTDEPHALEVEFEVPLMSRETAPLQTRQLRIELVQEHGSRHTLGAFRVLFASITGSVTGSVTRSITGSITGSVTAGETASETGSVTGSETASETGSETASETASETGPPLVDAAWVSVWRALQAHAAERPRLPTSLVLEDREVLRATRMFHRGSFLDPRAEVTPGVPPALSLFDATENTREFVAAADAATDADAEPQSAEPHNAEPHNAEPHNAEPHNAGPQNAGRQTRLDLARWLGDPRNALVHRVQVNRVWQHLFGRGLVATENDFGLRGALPSHPELLEWLAQDFVAHGQSRKALVRTIVTSATYRQSSASDPALVARDPDNTLLARQRRLRLEGEVLRDAMLVASGALDRTVGGPPVQPPQPDGVFAFTQSARTWTPSEGAARFRRSLYTRLWRSAPFPFYGTFDAPQATATCTRRERSVSPLQALALANDPMVIELCGLLAERIRGLWSMNDRGRVATAFEWCLARQPSDEEVDLILEHMDPIADERGVDAGWSAVARLLFNLEEFRYRP